MIGRGVGNYRISSLLGEGGMGLVYLAEHTTIDRKVAIKVLRTDVIVSADVTERFINEARVASTLRHPNVIEVFDTGVLHPEGVPYFVMELLEGEALADRLARLGHIAIPDALRWANETAAALGVAHAKGIIHRDLKPGNLFLVADAGDARDKIKVLDFGIAKVRGTLAGSSHTQTGSLMGTPIYMSPEQCRGTKEIDTRSDIYALGIVLYEMLCGAPPFVAEGFGDLITMHLRVPPEPPRTHNPAISATLEAAILRALAKKPEDRFATVQELQLALGFEPPRSGPMPPSAARTSTASRGPRTGPQSGSGTQVVNPSLMMAPQPGVAPSSLGGRGTRPAARRSLPLVIAGGVAAALAILIGVAHGQVGPRIKCLAGAGCSDLGDCYRVGKCGIVQDQKRACEVYDKDCAAGNLPGCVREGHCYEAHTGGFTTNWKTACDLYERACNAETMAGCAHLSDCYLEGLGGKEKSVHGACALAKRACDHGDPSGCVSLARCYANGTGGMAKDEKRACDLEKKSCDEGELNGCAMLALCYQPMFGDAPAGYAGHPEESCQTAKKACDDGGAVACWIMGMCYADGNVGFPKNEQRGCELFRQACDDGGFLEEVGCAAFAMCHDRGMGGFTKDRAKAESIQQRVCNDGAVHACTELGDRFKEGYQETPKDPVRACQLYEKACAGGRDCVKVARCACEGLGAPRDPARAHALFRKACDNGETGACEEDKTARCGEDPVANAARTRPPGDAQQPRAAYPPPPPRPTPGPGQQRYDSPIGGARGGARELATHGAGQNNSKRKLPIEEIPVE
jgi:TPR repeat protein/tRNA A-37 threonylcarbamoyl transferase component Bud32